MQEKIVVGKTYGNRKVLKILVGTRNGELEHRVYYQVATRTRKNACTKEQFLEYVNSL